MAIRSIRDAAFASNSLEICLSFPGRLDYQGKQGPSQTSQKASELLSMSKSSRKHKRRSLMLSLRFQSMTKLWMSSVSLWTPPNNKTSKLSTLDFQSKQKDAYGKRHAKTGQWLLETEESEKWAGGKDCSVRWCPGNPGVEKTVITSIAVNSIADKTQGQNVAITYVYCDYENSLTHSVSGLLGSMLRQLVEQASHSERINELRRFRDENSKHRNMTEDETFILGFARLPETFAISIPSLMLSTSFLR